MVKRSEDQWRELFEEQARSGLSAAAFCRARGLCGKHFSKRRRQLLGDEAKPLVRAFVQARVAPTPSVIEVQMGLVRLRIPGSVSVRWLADLVHELSG